VILYKISKQLSRMHSRQRKRPPIYSVANGFRRPGKARFKGRLIYKIANRVSRNPGAHPDRQKRPFIYKIGEPRKAAKSRLFTTLQVVNRRIRTLTSDDFYDPSLQAIVPFRPLRLVSHQILGSSPDGYGGPASEVTTEPRNCSLRRRSKSSRRAIPIHPLGSPSPPP
jgi:hypothetical protein